MLHRQTPAHDLTPAFCRADLQPVNDRSTHALALGTMRRVEATFFINKPNPEEINP
ncbi:hypothetical protein J7U46_20050 [Pelomonas sp. V22]|uniref:hypothetical protein n=1 Tax=Pelomonas sp. V22 TaxID=2822139 RepID=UPI0024A89932|nr:hypothetical protein [Pelomonas sp. V22]MDI4635367.1 hypothetical protein [Pelomonas sp. V22]